MDRDTLIWQLSLLTKYTLEALEKLPTKKLEEMYEVKVED